MTDQRILHELLMVSTCYELLLPLIQSFLVGILDSICLWYALRSWFVIEHFLPLDFVQAQIDVVQSPVILKIHVGLSILKLIKELIFLCYIFSYVYIVLTFTAAYSPAIAFICCVASDNLSRRSTTFSRQTFPSRST